MKIERVRADKYLRVSWDEIVHWSEHMNLFMFIACEIFQQIQPNETWNNTKSTKGSLLCLYKLQN